MAAASRQWRASAASEQLNALQAAFHEHHALQCGFCTPGMLMTATDLLKKYRSKPTTTSAKGLSGNLCRCTGYEHIVAAIRAVSEGDARTCHEDALSLRRAACACARAMYRSRR